MHASGLILAFGLLVGQAAAADGDWVLKGRVVDPQGQPVAGVDITTFWRANGVTHAQITKFEKEGGDASIFDINEGRMEAWGLNPVKSDDNGNFSLQMRWNHFHAFAIDKDRSLGAVYIRDSEEAPSEVEIKLEPLVRVHGRIRVPGATQNPEWTHALACVKEREQFPLAGTRTVMCSSLKGYFEFLIPPGEFELEAAALVAGTRYEQIPLKPIKVPAGQSDFDCGVLELVIPPVSTRDLIDAAKAAGTFGTVKPAELYGRPAPSWHVVETRRIAPTAQVSDFRGKWLLIYFWGPSCAPCIGKTLPALMRFYEEHAALRDRFEIVAVCIEADVGSLAEIERQLRPVVKSVWKKEIPFPVVFDNTLETAKRFGQEALGVMMLVDPEGILVEGDYRTLAEKLAKPAGEQPKPQ